jgi:hypothetical protein
MWVTLVHLLCTESGQKAAFHLTIFQHINIHFMPYEDYTLSTPTA